MVSVVLHVRRSSPFQTIGLGSGHGVIRLHHRLEHMGLPMSSPVHVVQHQRYSGGPL